MSNESITTAELSNALQSTTPLTVFDVRKKPAFDVDPRMLSNAVWQEFDKVSEWASQLDTDIKDKPVVVYCVHGHAVSQNAAKQLNEMGFNAKYLEGGIAQWIEDGFSVTKDNS